MECIEDCVNHKIVHFMCTWPSLTLSTGDNISLLAGQVAHCDDIIMGAMASQITSLTIVYSTFYSGADQSKHQSSASLAFVWGIHRGPVNSPHKWPVTRKMFLFDDVIMCCCKLITHYGTGGDREIHHICYIGIVIFWWYIIRTGSTISIRLFLKWANAIIVRQKYSFGARVIYRNIDAIDLSVQYKMITSGTHYN